MKINLKKSNTVAQKPWQVDFRSVEDLPDIKVVRTSFFFNAIAFILPAVVALFWVQGEIELSGLKGDIEVLEAEKATMIGNDDNLVDLSRQFRAEAAKIDSLKEYETNLFAGSAFITTLAKSCPKNIVLSSITLNNTSRISEGKVKEVIKFWDSTVKGFVVEEGVESTAVVNNFVEAIKKQELWAGLIEEASVENLSRDEGTGSLNFSLHITFIKLAEGGGQNE